MEERAEFIEQLVEHTRGREAGKPVRHLLHAAPGSEGDRFVRDLTAALRQAGRSVIHLDLPAYDIDASEHILGQLCQALGLDAVPGRAFDRHLSVHERINEITNRIESSTSPGKDAPSVVLYIPRSWFRRPEDPRRTLPDNPTSVLKALLEPGLDGSGLDAIVASAQTPSWLQRQVRAFPEDLPMPRAGEDYLFTSGALKALETEIKRLAGSLGSGADEKPPLVLRLGVACFALGHTGQTLQQVLQKPEPYRDLVFLLQDTLKAHPDWKPALSRLTLPRFPVPTKLLQEIAGEMNDKQRALAGCLVRHEDGEAKVDEALREIVGAPRYMGQAEREQLTAVSELLMTHYRASDGALEPREAVAKAAVVPWLEGNHFAAHSGPRGRKALEKVRPLSRLIRYELAWSLSVEFEEYEAAAGVYQTILKEDPGDAYSHHYLAWNLDQAGKDGATAWQEYKVAISLEADNPWYNSRFITFLRAAGFRRDAHEAWQRAIEHVLTGRWATRINLPRHFHSWVARSALDVGDLKLAEMVLGMLTVQDFRDYPKLYELREKLQQFEEIERLGEPIYPASVRMADRWKEPLLLPKTILIKRPGRPKLREAQLLDWYPGRVLSSADGVVTLLLAAPDRTPPSLFTVEVNEQALVGMASGDPPIVDRFLEYGGYEGQVARVRYHPPRRKRTEAEQRVLEHSLRYLRDEATPETT